MKCNFAIAVPGELMVAHMNGIYIKRGNFMILTEEFIDEINEAEGTVTVSLNHGSSTVNVDGDAAEVYAAVNTLIIFIQQVEEVPPEHILAAINQMALNTFGAVAKSNEEQKVLHELIRRAAEDAEAES